LFHAPAVSFTSLEWAAADLRLSAALQLSMIHGAANHLLSASSSGCGFSSAVLLSKKNCIVFFFISYQRSQAAPLLTILFPFVSFKMSQYLKFATLLCNFLQSKMNT
jgi:hypothetical protein